MPSVSVLIESLNSQVADFNNKVQSLNSLDKIKDVSVIPKFIKDIKIIRSKISGTLSKLNVEADKTVKTNDKNNILNYVTTIDSQLAQIKIEPLGQDEKFSTDFEAFERAVEKHLVEINGFLDLRSKVGDGNADLYFSPVGKKALSRINDAAVKRQSSFKIIDGDFVKDVALFKKNLKESYKKSRRSVLQIKNELKTAAWDKYTSNKVQAVDMSINQIKKLSSMTDTALDELAKLRSTKEKNDDYFGERGLLLINYIGSIEKQVSRISKSLSVSYNTELKGYTEENVRSGNDVSGKPLDETLWNDYLEWYDINQEQHVTFGELESDIDEGKSAIEMDSNFQMFFNQEKKKADYVKKIGERYVVIIKERFEELRRNFDESHPDPKLITASGEVRFLDVVDRNMETALKQWTDLYKRDDGSFFEERGIRFFAYIEKLQKDRLKEVKALYKKHQKTLSNEQKAAKKQANLATKGRFLVEDGEGGSCSSSSEGGSCSENSSSEDDS